MTILSSLRSHICKALLALSILTMANCLLHAQQSEATDAMESGTISGRVVNESGQPLSNAIVFARGFGATGLGRNSLADAEGNFRIRGLDTGLYTISAAIPAYIMPPRESTDIQANLTRVGDSVKITLVKGGVLTGTVTNSAGEPVIAIPVHAQMVRDAAGKKRTVGVESGSRPTDDRGIYRIYGLPAGTYVVFAGVSNSFGFNMTAYDSFVPTYAPSSTRDTAAEITLRAGDEITGDDIRYRGEPGHTVSGSVIGSGGPDGPGSYTVNLAAISNGKPSWSTSTIQPPNMKSFAITGLADGDYDLWSNAYVAGEVAVSEPKRIKIKGADVTGIEMSTKSLASVAGRLVFESSKAEACKDKRRPQLTEMLVYTQREEKPAGLVFERYSSSQVTPTKDSSFTLRNLGPGPYAFAVQFYAKYWYVDSISVEPQAGAKAAPFDAARNWTVLKPGDRITGLSIKLAEGAASLRGKVTTQNGQSLPEGISFYLVPAEREKAGDALRFYGSRINADGTFALNNLAPGRYWSIARVPGENEVIAKLSRPDQSEARLRIRREAELAKTEVELKPCENKIEDK